MLFKDTLSICTAELTTEIHDRQTDMDTEKEKLEVQPVEGMFREVKACAVISKEPEMEELWSGSVRDPDTVPVKSEVLKTDLSTICEDIHTETSSLPGDIQSEPSDSNKTREGEDTIHGDPDPSTKPSLSYVALIAKVILSSSSLKLNLASIYRAMEERFPYFRARGSGGQGQGWRNSVRHNLSLNECFVKVGRCEDGKGHHWGIHPAHLGNFLLGDFRQHRKARRSRHQRELEDKYSTAGSLGWSWTELGCSHRERHCGGRSGLHGSWGLMKPQYHPQEPRGYYDTTGSVDWTSPFYHSQRLHGGGVGSLGPYYPIERFLDSYDRPMRPERWCYDRPMKPTWRLHSWDIHGPNHVCMTEEKESCNSVLVRPHPLYSLPGCQWRSPVFKDIIFP